MIFYVRDLRATNLLEIGYLVACVFQNQDYVVEKKKHMIFLFLNF